MLRRIGDAIRSHARTAEPQTPLGRWCGAWYNDACDAMLKGSLADVDNSAWSRPPPPADDAPPADGAPPASAHAERTAPCERRAATGPPA